MKAAISHKLVCLTEPFTVGCRAARRAMPKQEDMDKALNVTIRFDK